MEVNYDGSAAGSVEVGAVTAGAMDGAENLEGAATANPDQADSATQPDGAAIEDKWDGSAFTLKYRDKPVVPQTKDELIKWAQLGYNNDLRMRNLDQRESKISEMEQQLAQIKQLSEAFDQRPDFKQAVMDIYQKLASGQQVAAEQKADQLPEEMQQMISPYVDEIRQLKEELNGIKGRFQEIDTVKADEEVKKEIDSLKQAHADEDWDTPDSATDKTLLREVIEHAAENGFKSLEAAYRDLRWDTALANAKAEALKGSEQSRIDAQKAGIVGKGGQAMPQSPKQINVRTAGYGDLAQMALAEMK